jgi:hypothetical protein
MKIKKGKTSRGFKRHTFTDLYGAECYLQKSSLATKDAIWLGVLDAKPQVMASRAASMGLETTKTTGWVPYPIPKDVLLTTQMHLTQSMVKKILPMLQHFAETGELP